MIPGKYDITIYKGATFSVTLSSENAVGTDVNFNDDYDDIRMTIRPTWAKMPYTEEASMDFTIANGRIVIPADGLSLTLNIDAADTEVIEFKDGKYALELVKHATTDPVAVEIIDKLFTGLVAVVEDI